MLVKDSPQVSLELHLFRPALTSQGAWAHPGRCHRASSHSSCQHCGSCALPGERHTELGYDSPEPPRASVGPQPSAPELPESQPESDTGCKAQGPRASHLQTQSTAQDQPIRTRKVQLEALDTANWLRRVRSPGTGHSLLVSSLLQSFLLLHCSYSTNSPCSAQKRSSPVTAGTPDSSTSLEKLSGTKAGLTSPPW